MIIAVATTRYVQSRQNDEWCFSKEGGVIQFDLFSFLYLIGVVLAVQEQLTVLVVLRRSG